MKATEQLKTEHKAVKVVLRVLERICERLDRGEQIDVADLDNIVDFLKVFVDQCHHAKEEKMLFEAVRRAGDARDAEQIAVLLKDHQKGRNYIKSLKEAMALYRNGNRQAAQRIAENARGYIDLLKQHIDMEDNSFFPVADKRLNEGKQDELYVQFEKHEEEEIGEGKHEEFHRMIEGLKKAYLE